MVFLLLIIYCQLLYLQYALWRLSVARQAWKREQVRKLIKKASTALSNFDFYAVVAGLEGGPETKRFFRSLEERSKGMSDET